MFTCLKAMSASGTPQTRIWNPLSRRMSKRHSRGPSGDGTINADETRASQVAASSIGPSPEVKPFSSSHQSETSSINSFDINPERARKWEMKHKWKFLPLKSSVLADSTLKSAKPPTGSGNARDSKNYSRPLVARAESFPPTSASIRHEPGDELSYESEHENELQGSRESKSSGTDSRSRYSAKAIYSVPSSSDSRYQNPTTSSFGSTHPLVGEPGQAVSVSTSEQRWVPPISSVAPRHKQRRRSMPIPAAYTESRASGLPALDHGQKRFIADKRKPSYWVSNDAALPGTVNNSYDGENDTTTGEAASFVPSTYDTSSLSEEKIAKLRKKGVNPALYLEMKHATRGKNKFGISPLVGNVFLG